MKKTSSMKQLASAISMTLAMGLTADALAQGNSPDAPGQSSTPRNLGHDNARNGVMALIHTNRNVLYTGDDDDDQLEVDVRFPRGASLLENEEVDAHLMVFSPEATFDVLPLSSEVSSGRNLFALSSDDLKNLPDGVYQLGVVLTIPEGDPADLNDWHNGLLGLVAVQMTTGTTIGMIIQTTNRTITPMTTRTMM